MNRNFGKIENGVFSFAPRELQKEGGFKILTNSAEEYALFGYLPVIRKAGSGEPEEKDGVIYLYEKEPEAAAGDEISGDEFLAAFEQALGV
nr:MAG TPA: hypothetical protein [Caudoviricetes sp.]